MDDLMKLLATISLKGEGNEKLFRTAVDGVNISTVNTIDMGYETAVVDRKGAYPVERYSSRADASIGHEKWCKDIVGVSTVEELSYGSLLSKKTVKLTR